MATKVFRKFRELLDVDWSAIADGEFLKRDGEEIVGEAGGGGGVTDHGALTGLADNDHPQYQLASGAATDVELASAIAGLSSVYQPIDSDITALAALTTTSFGRGLLELANQAALLSAAGAAAASHAHAGEDVTSGTVADARIAATIARDSEVTSAISALSSVYQPLDSDLTSIAALTTTSFGRSVLALADAAALLAAAGAAAASHAHSGADITSGTVVDARIDAAIARDSEVTSAVAAEASARTTADGLLVAKSLYDANTVLAATTDDTPAALTMGASTILARLAAGNIVAATPAQIRTLLNEAGLQPAVKTGVTYYYHMPVGGVSTNTPTLTAMQATPIWLPAGITLDRIGVEVTSTVATSVTRFGIYLDDGGSEPGALLADYGTVASATPGNKEITISQAITVTGLYWLAMVCQTAAATYRSMVNTPLMAHLATTFASPPTSNGSQGYGRSGGVTAGLPDPWGTVTLAVNIPRVYVRVT